MTFCVFVGNVFVLDRNVYRLWLLGFNVEQAISIATRRPSISPAIVRNLISAQYRNYELLEPFLHLPRTLATQLLFSLPKKTISYLIASYYSFDERVVREFLGKKLTSRARKELDDVCLATRVPLGGCRRMFDNLKRIIKRVEDSDGVIENIIMSEFNLERDLASHYAHIVFINNYRLDTSKKKLSYLSFQDFEFVASAFIHNLTISPDQVLEELDSQLVQDARDLKTILFNNRETLEEYKTAATLYLAQIDQQGVIEKSGMNGFTRVLRNILVIASGLSHNKEQRDIFINVHEKICECAYSIGWNASDVEIFLVAVVQTFQSIESISPAYRRRYGGSMTRIIAAFSAASNRFFTAFMKANQVN